MYKFIRLILLSVILAMSSQGLAAYQIHPADELNLQASKLLRKAPDSALLLLDKSIALAQKEQYQWAYATGLNLKGRLFMLQDKNLEAFISLQDALRAYGLMGDPERTGNSEYVIYRNLASILTSKNQFKLAISYYDSARFKLKRVIQNSKDIERKKKKASSLVDLLYFRAIALKRSGNIEDALKEFNEIWENNSKTISDPKGYGRVLNQLGLLNKDLKNYKEAKYFFEKIFAMQEVRRLDQGHSLHNYAYTLVLEKRYQESESYFKEAITKWNELLQEDSSLYRLQDLFRSKLDLGEAYYHQGKYRQAIVEWEEGVSLKAGIEQFPELFIVHNWLQQSYMLFDTEKANYHGALYRQQFESFLNIKNAIAAEFEGQAFRLQLENQSVALAHTNELQRQRRVYYLQMSLIIAGVGLLLFGLFKFSEWYRHRRFHAKMHGIASPKDQ